MSETKRFSVTLDPDLLDAAVRATGAASQREAIEEALRELVRRRGLERMARRGGTVELDRTVDELLAERARERDEERERDRERARDEEREPEGRTEA